MFNTSHLPQSEVDDAHTGSPARGPRDARALAPRFSRLALCVTAVSALTLGVMGTVAYGVWFNHDQQAYAEAIANARQSLGMPATQIVSADAGTPIAMSTAPAAGLQHPSPDNPDPSQQIGQPEEGSAQAVWSGQVAPALATANPSAGLAVAGLATTTIPADSTATASNLPPHQPGRSATGSSGSSAPQSASSRTVKDSRPGQQERRLAAANGRLNARLNAQQSERQNARHPGNLFARMGEFFRRVSYRQHGGANQQPDLYSHP